MYNFLFVAFALLMSNSLFAQTISIPLTSGDQSSLKKELSNLGPLNTEEILIQDRPYPILKKVYKFLSDKEAFSIICSEEFIDASPLGTNAECKVEFNFALSDPARIEVKDGFMKEFVVATISDFAFAKKLYSVLDRGTNERSFYVSREKQIFVHPTTGLHFEAFRLRIDCHASPVYNGYYCVVSAIK